MPRFVPSLCVLLIAISALALSAQDQQPDVRAPTAADGTLSWKFKEGQVLKTKLTQNLTMNTDMGGAQTDVSNNGVHEFTRTIKSVDADGVASATYTIDRMVMEAEGPGLSMRVDTSVDEEYDGIAGQIADAFTPMIGVEISQKIAPSGNFSDVEIPASMFAGINLANALPRCLMKAPSKK